ncbi:hypothetical protein K466DRAFT_486979 [Polyporus arcularius HHB13444]|uniref:Metallo-beta-lactamase domain-containing protein n=1 Tax=Polyporus arcularius HHB13444 TaxID=1314778 RepID=A0A5C3PHX3_9APHY|nr:hypothetical protein K466DRAFT_486979 [Polyporus arcularius HHB13444]
MLMHPSPADHTMGTLTFLRTVLGAPPAASSSSAIVPAPNRRAPQVEIYGPRGIRRMLRMLWYSTHTHSQHAFAVHELLFPGQEPSVAADVQGDDANPVDVRRESECVGRDIWCDDDGFWKGVVSHSPKYNHYGVVVDAGPILHRDPCIGYIIREVPPTPFHPSSRLPRKLVILGDTHDPSPLIPLIHADPAFALALPEVDVHGTGTRVRIPVSLLVHEATDAYIPRRIDPDERTGRNRTQESVLAKTVQRGHSTPAMAGAFAKRIGAERLVMNHIGARFPAPSQHGPQIRERFRQACVREIERQAAEAWIPRGHAGARPQAAWDYLSVVVPPNPRRDPPEEHEGAENATAEEEGRGDREESEGVGSVVSVNVEEVDAEAVAADPSGVVADVEMHSMSIHNERRGRGRGGRGRGRGDRGHDRGRGRGGRGSRGFGEAGGSGGGRGRPRKKSRNGYGGGDD